MIRGRLAATITAESAPNYDNWGYDEYWGCAEWIAWHKALKQKYGTEKANDYWLAAWEDQDSLANPYNWCKYNTTFHDYFRSQGIDVSNIFANIATGAGKIIDNTTDAAVILSNILKVAAPVAAIYFGGKLLINLTSKK